MLRVDPSAAREEITGRREDPSKPAWLIEPLLPRLANIHVENFLRRTTWETEMVLGASKVVMAGQECRALLIAKQPPSAQLPNGQHNSIHYQMREQVADACRSSAKHAGVG